MCIQHYFSYSFCSHISPSITLPCSNAPPLPHVCPRLKRIRTSLLYEFCPPCFLTSNAQLHLALNYASYKPKIGIHSYCAAEAEEATLIVSRAEMHFNTPSSIEQAFSAADNRKRLHPKIASVTSYLYYLLLNNFWASLQRNETPKPIQRILLLHLRHLIENEIRNEKLFIHFPPSRKEFIQQNIVERVDMSKEGIYPICEISRIAYGEAGAECEADSPVRIKSCGHVYGEGALTQWLVERGDSCPKDRKVVLPRFADRSAFMGWMEEKRIAESVNDVASGELKVLEILLGKEVGDIPEGVLLEELPIDREDFVQLPKKISAWMEMKDIFWRDERRVVVDPHDYYGQGEEGRDEIVQIEEYQQGKWVGWLVFVGIHPNCM